MNLKMVFALTACALLSGGLYAEQPESEGPAFPFELPAPVRSSPPRGDRYLAGVLRHRSGDNQPHHRGSDGAAARDRAERRAVAGRD